MMGFRYKVPRSRRPDSAPRPTRDVEDEGLTGVVQGKRASDLEERLARAFYKLRIPFVFQVPIQTRTSMPSQDRQVDFIIKGNQPVEPDGFIGHMFTTGDKARDYLRDLQLNEAFSQMGLRPIIHIPFTKLTTQYQTDLYVRRVLA